ncbi:MAG TPA: VOC family protein [Verrucomicrobiae bacterium]|nr:VOC family protein [Verrucomicrobiae bacterium]
MNTFQFKKVHPILGTRDLERALDFYITRLGFALAFRDGSNPTNYAGLRRDEVELHFQWQGEDEMSTTRLRLLVSDPDALFEEYKTRQFLPEKANVRNTPWGTREFAIYDPDHNALTFGRDLTKLEMQNG